MAFLIKTSGAVSPVIELFKNIDDLRNAEDVSTGLYFNETPGAKYRHVQQANTDFYIIGDFIIPSDFHRNEGLYLQSFLSDISPDKLQQSRGNFYILTIERESGQVNLYNSLMSILPVYYYDNGKIKYLSSRIDLILKACNNPFKISRKYILEHILFGYGFQDNTLFNGIKLLPTNNFLSIISGKIVIRQHTDIKEYFVTDPTSWRKSRDKLSDLFIQRVSDYLPDETYYSSLTGGLDGRTLLAIALKLKKNVITYSYGTTESKDVLIPRKIARALGIHYEPFILDEDYAINHFYENAIEAGLITEGNIRFSRATYHHFSKMLSKKSNYLISGNFGSELMRTLRMSGNLISPVVFDLFDNHSDVGIINSIRTSPRLKYLNLSHLKQETDELTEDCLKYKNALDSKLSVNQKFYLFLLEEVFRKYFGVEIVLENDYLINRTPFLDFVFIKELFKSELAGCNAEFKVSNPFDRFKGQALYPYVIKKTTPELLHFSLDRGYSPGNFLSFLGHLNIAANYYKRKFLNRSVKTANPSYNELVFSRNLIKLSEIDYNYSFVNSEKFASLFISDLWKEDHINFNIHVSFFNYLDHILNHYDNVTIE